MKEIVLDTETTGLSPASDKIIEIACIEIENHLPTGKKFHAFVNPGMDISEGAYQTHGITKEFLNDKPKFNEIAQAFVDFIKDYRLVIHNADFDLAFLNKELMELNIQLINKSDTLFIARDKYPGSQNSLDALCKRFKIDNSRREKHSALLDCELLTKVYIDLIDKKELTLDLSTDAAINSNTKNLSTKDRKQIIVDISQGQINEYQAFLKKNLPKSKILD